MKCYLKVILSEGHSISYHGVVFSLAEIEGVNHLSICSYSDYQPDRATEKMARSKINRAKDVAYYLATMSKSFKKILEGSPHRHSFCWDYGMGAVSLADELDGKIVWHKNLG